MEEARPFKAKAVLVTIAGVFAVIFFWTLLNNYLLKSRAVSETVDISFTPSTGEIKTGDENTADIFIKAPAGKGVSGIDIVLTAKNAQILDVSNAHPVSGDQTATFTEVLTDVAATGEYARKSVVAIQPDDKLSQVVRMQVIYQCTAVGESRLSIDKTKTEIVGNTTGDTYELGSLAGAIFNCSGDVVKKGPTVNIEFKPPSLTSRVGQNFGYELVFAGAPTGKKVSAIDVTLGFDPNLVEVSSIGDFIKDDFRGLASTPVVAVPPGANDTVVVSPPTTEKRFPDIACSTTEDCIKYAKEKGLCLDAAGTSCPLRCEVGKCVPCLPGENCATVPPPGGGLTPTPTKPPVTTIAQVSLPPVKSPPPPDTPPSTSQCSQLIKTWDNNTGQIRISYACIMPENSLPSAPHIRINFKAKAQGEGLVKINQAKVTGNIPEFSYVVRPFNAKFTILGIGDGDPTPPTGGDVKLNLALRLQGIQSKPKSEFNSMRCKVGIGDGGLKTPVSTFGDFKADDNGIWHGSVMLNVKPGSGFKALIKCAKHLQKKICDELPSEQKEKYAGTYSCDKGKITLKKGENNLDFSNIHLLVGDLPDQDGVTNSYDTSLVVNLLDKDDAESLRLADLNLDGKVNAIDHSLVIAALSIRHDEE